MYKAKYAEQATLYRVSHSKEKKVILLWSHDKMHFHIPYARHHKPLLI